MDLESIRCGSCGAPLHLAAGVNFVTCNHCQSHLAVRRDASATYTEVVEQLHANVQELKDGLAEVPRETNLNRLRQLEEEGDVVSGVSAGAFVGLAVGGLAACYGAYWTITAWLSGAKDLWVPIFLTMMGIACEVFCLGQIREAEADLQENVRKRLAITDALPAAGGKRSSPE